MMSAEGARMAETAGGLKKHSIQFTPSQWVWLQERAARTGSVSVAPVVRMVIQEAIDAESLAAAPTSPREARR